MKCIRPLVFSFAFLLAVGALAQSSANPSGQSSSPQDPAQQNPPAQRPPAAQPSQPPATQPAEPQPGQSMRPPTIDEQVNTLTQELNLDPAQQGKVKTVLEDQHQQAMTVVGDSAMPREEKVQKIHAIRENTISRVRAILNDDQKKKLDAMLQEQNEPPRKEPQGNPPPK